MLFGYLTRPDEYLIRYETVEWLAKSCLEINEFIDHRLAYAHACSASVKADVIYFPKDCERHTRCASKIPAKNIAKPPRTRDIAPNDYFTLSLNECQVKPLQNCIRTRFWIHVHLYSLPSLYFLYNFLTKLLSFKVPPNHVLRSFCSLMRKKYRFLDDLQIRIIM